MMSRIISFPLVFLPLFNQQNMRRSWCLLTINLSKSRMRLQQFSCNAMRGIHSSSSSSFHLISYPLVDLWTLMSGLRFWESLSENDGVTRVTLWLLNMIWWLLQMLMMSEFTESYLNHVVIRAMKQNVHIWIYHNMNAKINSVLVYLNQQQESYLFWEDNYDKMIKRHDYGLVGITTLMVFLLIMNSMCVLLERSVQSVLWVIHPIMYQRKTRKIFRYF